jgi:hypothetical protein
VTTQYTPILKLALPVTGELSGTWGSVVNDNITSMVEQAVAGLSTINTWTSDAHTLTTADGTSSEARCAMLVAQNGAGLTGAGTIICPPASKLYVLKNATSHLITLKASGTINAGSFVVGFTYTISSVGTTDFTLIGASANTIGVSFTATGAGTGTGTATDAGVAVPAGDTAFLFCNGTSVNACVTNIVNGHISGNLTVDGNTTLGNATSDTITATARFNTDLLPSTDNARDLGSSSNSWKDLYIDGTATIATLNVTTIDTTNLEVTNIKAKDGTAAIVLTDSTGAVTISTALTANGGAVFNENGANVDFRVEGDNEANLLFVDASADAVGIGTNAPAQPLDIVSNGSANAINVRGRSADDIGTLNFSTNAGTGVAQIQMRPGGNELRFLVAGARSQTFYTNGAEQMRLDSSGNLGLGVTPSAWYSLLKAFDVGSNAAAIYSGGITHNAYFDNTDLRWEYKNSSSSPATFLNIQGGQFAFNIAVAGTAGNAIPFTQAMTLDASGRLLVGTTSSYLSTFKSVVEGATSGSANFALGLLKTGTPQILNGDVLGNIYFYGADNDVTAGNNNLGAQISCVATTDWTTDGTTSNAALVFYTHGTTSGAPEERARITSGGDLLVGNTSGASGARLSIQGTGSYNSTGWGSTLATVAIRSNEMNNNAWNPTLNIAMIRQSLTTGNASFGGIGFTTIDDSNNSGIDDAARIAVINESIGSLLSNTALAFYTNNSGSNTGAATERARITSTGEFQWKPDGTTQAMTLDASGNLLVGDTTNPDSRRLRVYGIAEFDGNAVSLINYKSSGTKIGSSGQGNYVVSGGPADGFGIQSQTALVFGSGGTTERARIDSSGNLGVGETSPSTFGKVVSRGGTFSLVTDTSSQRRLSFWSTANGNSENAYIQVQNDGLTTNTGEMLFATRNTPGTLAERARITSGGDLLVGPTSVPSPVANYRSLVVGGSTGGIVDIGTTSTSYGRVSADSVGLNVESLGATTTIFRTDNAERARITSGGYFKASNSGAYNNSTGAYHELYQSTAGNQVVLATAASASYTGNLCQLGTNTAAGTGFYFIRAFANGVNQFDVRGDGNVTNTNGSYGTISDQKMKTDIVDAGSQWSDIKAMRFRKFKMKDDPSGLVQLGVVAQEVELTSPGLVDEHQDRDAEGNDLGTTTKSVKTSVLLMKAAVALQEAMARIETLEAEVAALKGA